MKCPNCGFEFFEGYRCPNCGIDVYVFQKAHSASIRLYNKALKLAEERVGDLTIPFEQLVKEDGFTLEELEELSESVEFE